MKALFLPAAEAEFREAAKFYESETSGLGTRFIAAVHETLSHIKEHPQAAPLAGAGVRTRVVSRFPFSVVYSVEGQDLVIVAIAHHRRRPRFWQVRLSR